MAARSQELSKQPRPQPRENISSEHLPSSSSLDHFLPRDGRACGDSCGPSLHASHLTTTGSKAKRQPWKAVWPAPREPSSQANMFGFKKGEVMIFDGNAGNFFARDSWTIEQEVDKFSKRTEGTDTASLAEA